MSSINILGKIHQTARRVLLFLLVAVSMTACINDEKRTHENTTLVNVGDMAPDFSVELLDGGSVTLSSLHGEVVMLIFFSTECPDCQNQFAEIQRMITEQEPSFKILAISREESVESTEQFRQKYGITFDVGTDPDRNIYDRYATLFVPRNFLISPKGRVEALTVEYNPDELHAIWEKAEEMCK